MKALVWHSPKDIRCDEIPDPKIEHPRDAILKVTTCAICGSDLHLYNGYMPGMQKGDVVGHEFMGEVMEVGPGAKSALKVGDRIVVPFTIFCGECEQCRRGNFSVCETTNRNKDIAAKIFGRTTAGLFGYTHLTGGYPGGQAQYVRIPYADKTHIKVPQNSLSDEQLLFLGDIFPTGWQAVVQCDIQPTDTVLREMAYVCRPAGTLSIPGVYGGVVDKFPIGMVMNKGLTIRAGQTHVNRWTDDLLRRIQEGQIDPSFVITHSKRLEDGPAMYKTFRDKEDGCIKVVLKPN